VAAVVGRLQERRPGKDLSYCSIKIASTFRWTIDCEKGQKKKPDSMPKMAGYHRFKVFPNAMQIIDHIRGPLQGQRVKVRVRMILFRI
jgi:hypothetical protein